MASGLVFALIGWHKAGAANEEIDRLDGIAEERGWNLSVSPQADGVALGLAYKG